MICYLSQETKIKNIVNRMATLWQGILEFLNYSARALNLLESP